MRVITVSMRNVEYVHVYVSVFLSACVPIVCVFSFFVLCCVLASYLCLCLTVSIYSVCVCRHVYAFMFICGCVDIYRYMHTGVPYFLY